MHVGDSTTADPSSLPASSGKTAWMDSAHLAAGRAPKTDRHDALQALHKQLARTERHVQDLLHAGPMQE